MSRRGGADFSFILISAMYENGGNTTHRFLDGHPQLHVYPFESQLGTRSVVDALASMFPVKYRWPVFDLAADAAADYHAIIDEECKVRLRTPHVSKFRDTPMDLDDEERKSAFVKILAQGPRTRGRIVEAFFRATFEAWHDAKRTGEERAYVGYSPIVVVDAGKIVADLPGGHVLHVVRNPWSAYADTKKRPVPLSLEHYMTGWILCQQAALVHRARSPGRVHLVRYEDVIADPEGVLGGILEGIGLRRAPSLARPSWNGKALATVHPWGTIVTATREANLATAAELSEAERDEVGLRAGPYLGELDYERFLEDLPRPRARARKRS